MEILDFLINQGFKLFGFKDGLATSAEKNIGNIKITIDFYNSTMFVFYQNKKYSEKFKDYTFWQEYKHMMEYVNKLGEN